MAVKVCGPAYASALRAISRPCASPRAGPSAWAPTAQRLRPREVVETLARSVAIEMDLRLEAAARLGAGRELRDDPDFRVPDASTGT